MLIKETLTRYPREWGGCGEDDNQEGWQTTTMWRQQLLGCFFLAVWACDNRSVDGKTSCHHSVAQSVTETRSALALYLATIPLPSLLWHWTVLLSTRVSSSVCMHTMWHSSSTSWCLCKLCLSSVAGIHPQPGCAEGNTGGNFMTTGPPRKLRSVP